MSLYSAYTPSSKNAPAVDIEQAVDTLSAIDWFRILDDLAKADWKPRRVAALLEVALSTVQGWKAGSEPHHDTGEKLLLLHKLVCSNTQNSGREAG